jgi:ornithine cyclodeaminase/alanine dehydrogenase
MLHLTSHEVERALTMAGAISAIEQACKEQIAGDVIVGQRQNLWFPGGWIRLMPAAMIASRIMGYKQFHLVTVSDPGDENASPEAHVRYSITLFDMDSGAPLCAMDANHLTALRTGAAAGLATDRLARQDATHLAIIGSGAEARAQVEAVAAVRTIASARVFGRNADRRFRFAEEMGARLDIEIAPADSAQEAVEGADIVIVATLTDGECALEGRWLERGQHVTSIGSTMPTQREIDPEVWQRATCTVVDTRSALTESGDAIAARDAGAMDEGSIVELSELVSGQAIGRTGPADLTLYKSVGTGLQDIAVAVAAYRHACDLGLGDEIADYRSVKSIKPN